MFYIGQMWYDEVTNTIMLITDIIGNEVSYTVTNIAGVAYCKDLDIYLEDEIRDYGYVEVRQDD